MGLAFIEFLPGRIHVAQPDMRLDIARIQLDHPLIRRNGLVYAVIRLVIRQQVLVSPDRIGKTGTGSFIIIEIGVIRFERYQVFHIARAGVIPHHLEQNALRILVDIFVLRGFQYNGVLIKPRCGQPGYLGPVRQSVAERDPRIRGR